MPPRPAPPVAAKCKQGGGERNKIHCGGTTRVGLSDRSAREAAEKFKESEGERELESVGGHGLRAVKFEQE